MRKQWSCSKCGFACKSTWRNLSPSKPIICNACRSNEGNNKVNLDDPKRVKQSVNEEAKVNPLNGNSSLTHENEISPSSSISHENVAFSVSQIGMVFGNLTFEPTLAIPVIIGGKSLGPRVKSEVVTAADDDCVTQVQGRKSLKPSTTSTLGDTTIQTKQEHESEQTEAAEDEAIIIWDSNKVQKKKRSKLPQYTLSPLARFINQLQDVSCYRYRHRRRVRVKSAAVVGGGKSDGVRLKYDDVLIYEKCRLYVAENEIGLGAELLSPPVYDSLTKTTSFVVIKEESSSTSGSSAYSTGLVVDVPVN